MNSSKPARTDEKRLTTDGKLKWDPVFINGGAEVVFTLQETPTQTRLMRLKIEDGSVSPLHSEATTSEFEATYSADSLLYAFVQNRGNLNLKLILRDTTKKKDAIFDPGSGFACIRRPSMSADGSQVVFSMPNAAGQQIYLIDSQGANRKELTRTSLNNWPAFSPDGSHIAFSSSRDGNFDIYVMELDGGKVARLTRSPGMDIRPAWSPDGRRLAFTSNRNGRYQIFIMQPDGNLPTELATDSDRDDYVAWHPDGRNLILVAEKKGRTDLYQIPAPI
jgi:dipeptidyl aminopeptidase/acylaminoacyl peptidase